MNPNENHTTAAVLDVSWVMRSDEKGGITQQQLTAAACVELVKGQKRLEQLLEELVVAVKALDASSFDETREAVREMLKAEFGLVRK